MHDAARRYSLRNWCGTFEFGARPCNLCKMVSKPHASRCDNWGRGARARPRTTGQNSLKCYSRPVRFRPGPAGGRAEPREHGGAGGPKTGGARYQGRPGRPGGSGRQPIRGRRGVAKSRLGHDRVRAGRAAGLGPARRGQGRRQGRCTAACSCPHELMGRPGTSLAGGVAGPRTRVPPWGARANVPGRSRPGSSSACRPGPGLSTAHRRRRRRAGDSCPAERAIGRRAAAASGRRAASG